MVEKTAPQKSGKGIDYLAIESGQAWKKGELGRVIAEGSGEDLGKLLGRYKSHAVDLGRMSLEKGDPNAAIRFFRDAVLQDDKDPAGFVGLGEAFLWQDRTGLAKAAFKQALALDPENIPARMGSGEALMVEKDYLSALMEYVEVIEHNPKHAEAYKQMSNAYRELGEAAKAVKCLDMWGGLVHEEMQGTRYGREKPGAPSSDFLLIAPETDAESSSPPRKKRPGGRTE